MKRRILHLALSFLLLSLTVSAQERKKVAVVLSGGGAKGVAHIGALKVVERAGIPIDIITGTSMGSIVGGLYAIGYSPELLDSVVRAQNWTSIFTDKENLAQQSLADVQKQNTYFYTMGLTLGKRKDNDGGLIKGTNLGELFKQLCEGYTDSLDFSRDLPIPFACVATNLVDNTEVDFHSGRLPQAMRASMAIPAVFSPVRIGNRVLVDGGLRNNYPADIARQMGADIIIGVIVPDPPKDADGLGTTKDIISQIIDLNCQNKYDDNLAITDVLCHVNVKGYTAASFSPSAIDTLIRRGEEEAMRHWDELLALKERIGVTTDDEQPRPLPKYLSMMNKRQRVTAYEFYDMTIHDERFLRRKFHLRVGDSIDTQRQQELATTLRVDLFYKTAECLAVPDSDGVRIQLFAGHRKTSQVGIGVRFDNEEYASLQLGANFPVAKTVPLNADFTLRLGKRLMARGELTLHSYSLDRPKLSYTFWRNDIDVYINGERDYSTLYSQHQAELFPANFMVRNFNFTLSLRWDHLHYTDRLLSAQATRFALTNDHYFSYRAVVRYNSENDWYFPTRGSRFKAEYAYVTDNFGRLDGATGMSDVNAHWRTNLRLGSRFTLQPILYSRMLFGPVVPLVFSNLVGGPWFSHYVEQQMPFAGIGNMEHVEIRFVAAALQAQQHIGNNHYLQFTVACAQHSDRMRTLFRRRTLTGFQAAYYYRTLFGPLGVAFGYSNKTSQPYFHLNLGYEF